MSGNKEQSSNNIRRWVFTIFIIAALYLLLIFAINIYVEYDEILFSLDKTELQPHELAGVLGTKGDYFGGLLNPMFAFFSLIALLATIRIQLSELAMMREELTKTTEANEKQAEALEEQVKAARQQQFDNTFSTLLSEHSKVLTEIAESHAAKGMPSFQSCKSAKDVRDKVLASSALCKYYRVLYQLLKFIVRNHPDNKKRDFSESYLVLAPSDEEKAYSSLVRAMIPSDLLMGLAGNCAFGRTTAKDYLEYTLLVERYSMLEHLNMKNIYTYYGVNKDSSEFDFICLYKKKAFGENTGLSRTLSRIREASKSKESDIICPFTYEDILNKYDADTVVVRLLLSSELVDFKKRKDAELKEEWAEIIDSD